MQLVVRRAIRTGSEQAARCGVLAVLSSQNAAESALLCLAEGP